MIRNEEAFQSDRFEMQATIPSKKRHDSIGFAVIITNTLSDMQGNPVWCNVVNSIFGVDINIIHQ